MLQVNPVASRSIWIGGAGLDIIVAALLFCIWAWVAVLCWSLFRIPYDIRVKIILNCKYVAYGTISGSDDSATFFAQLDR